MIRNAGAGFFLAMYTVYLTDYIHLSQPQAQMVNFAFFATCFVLELPTGALADIFGRKRCYIASCLVSGLAFLLYARARTMHDCIIAEICAGVGSCLASGAFQAWFKHSLTYHNEPEMVGPALGKSYVINCVTGILTAKIGAFLKDGEAIRSHGPSLLGTDATCWLLTDGHHQMMPWLLAGVLIVINALLAFILMRDHHRAQGIETPGTVLNQAKERLGHLSQVLGHAIRFAAGNRHIRMIVLMIPLMAIAVQAPNMQWQPYFRDFHGIRDADLGNVWAAVSLSLALGGEIARRVLDKLRYKEPLLLLCMVSIGLGIAQTVLAASTSSAFIIFFAQQVSRGFYRPCLEGYIHDLIPENEEDRRATILSLTSMPSHLGSMVGLYLSGRLNSKTANPEAWVISGYSLWVGASILLVFSLALLLRERRTK
jgi:MFS family permease